MCFVKTARRVNKNTSLCSIERHFCFYAVAGPGVEPGSQGYEPYEVTVPLTRDALVTQFC